MAGSNFDWVDNVPHASQHGYVDSDGMWRPFKSLMGADGYPLDPEERIAAGGRIFYNIEMAKKVREIKKPFKDLVVDIKLRPNYLALVIYEDQVMEDFLDIQREEIMNYLNKIRDLIRSYGVRCEFEGAKGRAKSTY